MSTQSTIACTAIDVYIEQQMRRLKIPGVSLAVVQGDEIVHQRGFGRTGPNGGVPTPQTTFAIGSLTKSFTALAVMQLVEAGKIALDDPVQRYLPWFRVADRQASASMTVRHLLHQTSGLPNLEGLRVLADFDDDPGATERQARALATLKTDHPPGSAFEYSNLNYNLLGLVIESASGESYASYIQGHILSPLKMDHTHTSPAQAAPEAAAVGHRYWFGFPVATPNLPMPRGSLSSGQLISCAQDMARYLIAHLSGDRYRDARLLSGAGIDALLQGTADYHVMGALVGRYGMGWFESDMDGARVAWHSGTVPDFAAYMALLSEQNRGVVLLMNADHYMMNPVFTDFGMQVTALVAGRKPGPSDFGFISLIPWMLRALPLVPLAQAAGLVATLLRLRRWRRHPGTAPGKRRLLARHLLPSLIPNLALAAVPVTLLARRMLRPMALFFPDGTWIALLCGGWAAVWTFLRSRLLLRAARPDRAQARRHRFLTVSF